MALGICWRYCRSGVIQKTVSSIPLSSFSLPPPNNDITAILLREMVWDIHSDGNNGVDLMAIP
jgi:hypothetical protein